MALITVTASAICADIAEHATRVKNEQNVGMYWALQKFASKFGITIAGAIFAGLITLGRDRGDDLGLRITAVFGALILCFTALFFKQRFHEKKLQMELRD